MFNESFKADIHELHTRINNLAHNTGRASYGKDSRIESLELLQLQADFDRLLKYLRLEFTTPKRTITKIKGDK